MKIFNTLFLSLLLLVGHTVVAQSITPPNPRPPGPGLPIDSVLWVLGVVAIVFGVYMLRKRNSKVVQ